MSNTPAQKPKPLTRRTQSRLLRNGIGTIAALLFGKLWRWRRKESQERVAVFVTRSDIEPANHGAAVKIRRLAAAMSRELDAVFIVTHERRECYVYRQGEVGHQRFPAWIRWLSPPRQWVILKLLLRGFPVSNLFLYYPLADFSYATRALWLGRRHNVVLWQAEFPAYARACIWGRSVFGGPVILAEHNVEYERIRQQVPGLKPESYELLRYWELRLCLEADVVVCVSEPDRNRLHEDGVPEGRLCLIPHGVDLQAFARAGPVDLHGQYGLPPESLILVYHGTYRYPPNLEAMAWLGREVMPRLRDAGLSAQVLAIGRDPPARSPHPDIRFTGPERELAPVLKAAHLAVVPLRQGGGTRMKVLDYFAAGLPVISTTKGVEGLPLAHGREVWIADEAQSFADAVLRLAADPAGRNALRQKARAFVERLDWSAIAARYLALLDPR